MKTSALRVTFLSSKPASGKLSTAKAVPVGSATNVDPWIVPFLATNGN